MPHFLGDMRRERREKHSKGLYGFLVDSVVFLSGVDHLIRVLHKSADNRIHRKGVEPCVYFFYHLVFDEFCLVRWSGGFILIFVIEFPYLIKITEHAVDTSVVPFGVKLGRADEKLVHTERVAAVFCHKLIGRNYVALGLAHFSSVLVDHTLVEQSVERLLKLNHSDVIEEFCIESCVKKMKHCMLYSSDIKVNGSVFPKIFLACQFLIVMGIRITEEVPA